MGDRRKRALRVQFDGELRLEFHGAKITSDAGLLPFRKLDEAFRLTEQARLKLSDSRRGKNTQRPLLAILRQKVLYESFAYQAQSWDRPRRVVAKVEWHCDELFPRVGFIVTNLTGWSNKVMTFQLAEVAVLRELFASILERIQWFGVPPPLVQRG